MLELGPEVCGDLVAALSREWLETDGLGGFASSTIVGVNTRRYHALLLAALRPPTERHVLLSTLEERLIVDGRPFDLGANQYPGTIHPEGYRYLTHFRLDPFPIWTFRLEDLELEKRFFLTHGEPTAVVTYRVVGSAAGRSVQLELRPLLAYRDYHSLARENASLDPAYAEEPGVVRLRPYARLPELYLAHNAESVRPQGFWYRNFEYEEERRRGLDFVEDLHNPLVLTYDLSGNRDAVLIASLHPHEAAEAPDLAAREQDRRATVAAVAPVAHPLAVPLTAAADQFIVRRGEGSTILAGYPWFTDWGRDTMIALPGLTLVTGRFEVARNILLEFSRHMNQGLLPNRFPDRGEEAEYNTVDATLWYFQAIHAYLHYTNDTAFVRRHLYERLLESVEWHGRGTHHHIRVDEEGLITGGEEGYQLTWMDARIGDWVVTPRRGRPVEIQALWYNALRILADLARRFEHESQAASLEARAAQASRSFNRLFWDPDTARLHDVMDGEEADRSFRPNQILAVSLPHSMLSKTRARQVVDAVGAKLLTPYGLRTLTPDDDRYRSIYEGGPWERDSRYHQGTVWPWLLGPFITAYVKVHGGTAKSRREAGGFLAAFEGHLTEAGLAQISEILDGDPPHLPRGCFAQAWSVAELLRALVEDVMPPHS